MACEVNGNMSNLTFKQRLLECIREYHKQGFITDNEMSKGLVKKFHNKHLKHAGLFMLALRGMLKQNIVFHPQESGKADKIVFKPGKLDLILDGQDAYITKSENKYVVSQEIGFRAPKKTNELGCTFCNKTFGSKAALKQHSRAKGHVVARLKKLSQNLERYDERSMVCAEIVRGKGNAPETVFNNDTTFGKILVIVNRTSSAITLDNIEGVNTDLNRFINIVFESGVSIPSGGTYDVQLNLNFDVRRSYNMPLIITYSDAANDTEGGVQGIDKHLVFEIVSNDYERLQPTSPYRRPMRIASDMDETIVPGEKPEFQSDFVPMYRLQKYELTAELIKILNSGLNPDKVEERSRSRLLEIKALLNVEDPMDCLTRFNYREMLDLLLYLEEHQMKIDIRNYDTITDKLFHIRGNIYELEVPDLSENRPSLIVGDSVFVKQPGSEIKYEGIVHEKYLDRVKLGFSHKFAAVYVKKMKFEVSFGYNRTTLKLEHQAAKLAMHAAEYFFPEEIPPSAQQDLTLNCYNRNINGNEQQLQAVKEIVKGTASDVPYLIFGPPGTGKTMTVVEAILQVRKHHQDQRILICAPSNSAANLICTRLLKFSSFSEKDLLRYVSYSYSASEIPDEMRKYCNIKNGSVCHPTMESLMEFKLVITTLTTAGRLYNIGIPRKHFSYVFIDEGGHATESETLIPITAALVDKAIVTGRVILAGDPMQLGPIIHSSLALKYGFGVSMLERLMTKCTIYKKHDGVYDNRVLTKLLNNYRSHPAIIALSNEEFYENELISQGNEFSNLALGHDVLPNKKFPLIFHSVLGTDQRESNSPSFYNIQEIITVFNYLDQLVGTRMSGTVVEASDIAVITPYRKQVQKIRQMCKGQQRFEHLEVGSIEKLQGQERLIVIISTVRSKPEFVQHDVKFHLGFLKNPKRMNVALTRAKALLIVIGNPNLLKYDDKWRKYIQRCVDNSAIAGAPFSMDMEDDAELLEGFENIRIDDDIHFGRGNH